jgi:ubiquinone/menaquinone biosynthesis C-methylase UbiE
MAQLTWTGERTIPEQCTTVEEMVMYFRHLAAYAWARDQLTPDATVLDIGCGTGYGTRLLSDKGVRAIGLDVDAETIAYARSKYGSGRCEFYAYDGHSLPFGDAEFSACVSFQVIEHVVDDNRFVAEAKRVLKPNGSFVVTTPNGRMRLEKGQRPWNRFHIREYSATELANLLGRHFSQVTMQGIRASPVLYAWERQRIDWAQKTIKRDPFNLRRFLPERLKPRIVRLLKSVDLARPATATDAIKVDLNDFQPSQENPDEWLDLLGVCRPA